MSTWTRITAVALATLAAGALALPAAADGGRPPVPAPLDDDARAALCERIPAARERIEDRIAAVEADEDAPGSLARLGARAGRAENDGREHVTAMLERRAERRTERLDRLHERLEGLDKAESAFCTGS